MADRAISLYGLGRCFGKTIAVDSISLDIGEGDIFGLLGANGSGKTTTIRMLCGLTRPTHGKGVIHGLDIWHDRSRLRSQFGYVAQRFSLYADLTVLENLQFFGGAYRVTGNRLARRIQQLLSELNLAQQQNSKAGSLSAGFKQLLSLSCALIHQPSLLFLDEPTVGLDPTHRQYIWSLLYGLARRGTTIVLTTHYMDEADRCTKVGFLQCGQLLTKGSPLALKERLHSKLLEIEVENVMDAIQILRRLPSVYGIELRNGRLRLQARDAHALLNSWLKHWPCSNIRLLGYSWAEPDMEDVFLACSQGYYTASGLENKNTIGDGRTEVSAVNA
jgi:ABC-2 type transport system ATP-binding protein